jgi:hypothetical protein
MAEFVDADFVDVVDDGVFVMVVDEFVTEDSFTLMSPECDCK